MAHPLIVEAATLGVRVEVDGSALVVAPASKLPAELRARIIAAKPALLAELAANDDTADADRDPARWARFKALCIGRGIRPDELARHFPGAVEREDIACSADAALDTFAEHMARVILAERAHDEATTRTASGAPDAWRTRPVTCGACLHLVRVTGHPHTGHCAVRSPQVTSAVLWDDDTRTCSRFEVAA